ncbi:hypothetical protein RDWZM_005113 [Blomia tropicalis]|uniref:Checkpoint protein RAD24-like helical bundle domain-containing protein n=1 Tax=Blomia tropicalis TaxID=40697 RepID=A0A9Q0M4W6_BLOTA|nr:hypothetical protein RDWZM_005113 [Blomia tropicalis]
MELAVSKPKLTELNNWFNLHFKLKNNVKPFLLLNGPAGSGKTISIKILCKEYGIEFIEYESSSSFHADKYDAVDDAMQLLSIKPNGKYFDQTMANHSKNQLTRFKEFLRKINYCRKSLYNDNEQRLLIIEDIPNLFCQQPKLLHKELMDLRQKFGSKTIPIVFIISETVNCPSLEYTVLPKSIQAKLNFEVITFRPIADTAMRKAIANTWIGKTLTKMELNNVVECSSNDIRNAFNYLLFKHLNVKSNHSSISLVSTNKKMKLLSFKSNKNSSISSIDSGREEHLTLIHAIGKIVYAKRDPKPDQETLQFLNKHNSRIDKIHLRNKLVEDKPETIAERCSANCDTITAWLHENYFDFIHDKDDGSLNYAVQCLDQISTIDSLYRNYESSQTMEQLRTSYLIRGQMFLLNRDSSAYPDGNKSKFRHSFHQLRGPQWKSMHLIQSSNQFKLKAMKESELYSSSLAYSDRDFVLDILPNLQLFEPFNDRIHKLNFQNFYKDLCEFN